MIHEPEQELGVNEDACRSAIARATPVDVQTELPLDHSSSPLEQRLLAADRHERVPAALVDAALCDPQSEQPQQVVVQLYLGRKRIGATRRAKFDLGSRRNFPPEPAQNGQGHPIDLPHSNELRPRAVPPVRAGIAPFGNEQSKEVLPLFPRELAQAWSLDEEIP